VTFKPRSNTERAPRARQNQVQPQIPTENLSAVAMAAIGKKVFFKRKKTCPLSGSEAPKIDYKDVKLLTKFLSERGKILPSRITAVSTKKQRELAAAVKRARDLALIAPVNK